MVSLEMTDEVSRDKRRQKQSVTSLYAIVLRITKVLFTHSFPISQHLHIKPNSSTTELQESVPIYRLIICSYGGS